MRLDSANGYSESENSLRPAARLLLGENHDWRDQSRYGENEPAKTDEAAGMFTAIACAMYL